MKFMILIVTFLLSVFSSFAQKRNANDIQAVSGKEGLRPIDITIVINGSTVRISGTVRINMLTSTMIFEGNITVAGNGESVQIPVSYNGPMKKGPYKNIFTRGALTDNEFEIADWISSRLMLQTGKATFEQEILEEQSQPIKQ